MKKVNVTIGLLFDDNLTDEEIDDILCNTSYSFIKSFEHGASEEIETEGFDYDLSETK